MTNKKVPSEKKKKKEQKEEEIKQTEFYKAILAQFFPKPFFVLSASDQRLKFLSSVFCLSRGCAKEWFFILKINYEGGSS